MKRTEEFSNNEVKLILFMAAVMAVLTIDATIRLMQLGGMF